MHSWYGLQACLFKCITVAAFHIYAKCGKDSLKGEDGGCACSSHGNYIVDHGKIEKSWNCVFEFLWEPCSKNINRRKSKWQKS